ncbi:MAG: transposase [Azoarcus sp.]|nr:transposase [Azoarcus sp.]
MPQVPANWLRILLAGRAYTLMQGLKRLAPRDTERATATSATIRARLL